MIIREGETDSEFAARRKRRRESMLRAIAILDRNNQSQLDENIKHQTQQLIDELLAEVDEDF